MEPNNGRHPQIWQRPGREHVRADFHAGPSRLRWPQRQDLGDRRGRGGRLKGGLQPNQPGVIRVEADEGADRLEVEPQCRGRHNGQRARLDGQHLALIQECDVVSAGRHVRRHLDLRAFRALNEKVGRVGADFRQKERTKIFSGDLH